jgi:hypothetical protein
MEQCREVMRFDRLALLTEEAYLQWIKRFLVFHRVHGAHGVSRPTIDGWRRPEDMGEPEVEVFGRARHSVRAGVASRLCLDD